MLIREDKKAEWQKFLDYTKDPEAMEIVRFAEDWAVAMEHAIGGGTVTPAIALRTAKEVSPPSVPAVPSFAAILLTHYWAHGQELNACGLLRV